MEPIDCYGISPIPSAALENYNGWFWSSFTEKPYTVTSAVTCVRAGRKQGNKRTWPLEHLSLLLLQTLLLYLDWRVETNKTLLFLFPNISYQHIIQDGDF